MASRNIFDSTDTFQVKALRFSFPGLLQEELNIVMEHWNTYSIRKNRFGTVSGCPDALYYLSESFGGTPNLMQNVPDQELQYSWEYLIIHEEENVYFEYFKYVMNESNLSYPSSREETLTLYQSFVEANSTGV